MRKNQPQGEYVEKDELKKELDKVYDVGFKNGRIDMKNKKLEYKKLLKLTPKHDSLEFVDFLRENNKVIWENDQWIVIENFKYHTKENKWWTAFHKGSSDWYVDIDILWYKYHKHEWIKKSVDKQTVKRFHIHIIPSTKK